MSKINQPPLFHDLCFVDLLFTQDLSKLGRDLKKVLIVDNSPASYSFHPENAVSVDVFGNFAIHNLFHFID